MIRNLLSALAIASLAVATTGCEVIVGPTVCTGVAMAALSVDIRDSTTNAPAGRGARIVATTGALADTVDVAATADFEGPYGLAHERPGLYTVTVEQEGYQTWTRSGIRVTKDECHVRTVSVLVRLQP